METLTPLEGSNWKGETCSFGEEQKNQRSTGNEMIKEGYESKKPLWWKRLSGRRATKGQRACMERMKAQGYVITSLPKYGESVDVEHLFNLTSMAGQGEENERVLKKELIVELGFGDGKNLLANACCNAERLYLGADIHQPGVCSLLKQIESYNESNNIVLKNIMVYPGDGVKLIRSLPMASVSQIMVTFPDPWPNKHQEKFRIIQQEVVMEFERVLLDHGLVLIATDSSIFADWTRHVFTEAQSIQDSKCRRWVVRRPPCRDEWLPVISKYELEGSNASRVTILQCWELLAKEH
jgi:tRNA (guanine-N(7)-)-methyltransferase